MELTRAALRPEREILELGSILLAALCFWSGVLGRGRLNDGGRALLVMTAAILTDLPGVVMSFAASAFRVMPRRNAAAFGLRGAILWRSAGPVTLAADRDRGDPP